YFADPAGCGVSAGAGRERLAEKSPRTLAEAIASSKTRGLSRLLNGLGIRMVGERAAQLLAVRFGTMERLEAASEADIGEIHGIGPQIAPAGARLFAQPPNQAAGARPPPARGVPGEAGARPRAA